MKKVIVFMGIGVVIGICICYMLTKSTHHPSAGLQTPGVVTKNRQQPAQQMGKATQHVTPEIKFSQQQPETDTFRESIQQIEIAQKFSRSEEEETIALYDQTDVENSVPPELPDREDLPIEPEPESIDYTQLHDSVDVMEIELADYLLAYDISDDRIDRIFEKILADSLKNDVDDDASDQYLQRLQSIARLIQQSDMDGEQLKMAIEDIFPDEPL